VRKRERGRTHPRGPWRCRPLADAVHGKHVQQNLELVHDAERGGVQLQSAPLHLQASKPVSQGQGVSVNGTVTLHQRQCASVSVPVCVSRLPRGCPENQCLLKAWAPPRDTPGVPRVLRDRGDVEHARFHERQQPLTPVPRQVDLTLVQGCTQGRPGVYPGVPQGRTEEISSTLLMKPEEQPLRRTAGSATPCPPGRGSGSCTTAGPPGPGCPPWGCAARGCTPKTHTHREGTLLSEKNLFFFFPSFFLSLFFFHFCFFLLPFWCSPLPGSPHVGQELALEVVVLLQLVLLPHLQQQLLHHRTHTRVPPTRGQQRSPLQAQPRQVRICIARAGRYCTYQ